MCSLHSLKVLCLWDQDAHPCFGSAPNQYAEKGESLELFWCWPWLRCVDCQSRLGDQDRKKDQDEVQMEEWSRLWKQGYTPASLQVLPLYQQLLIYPSCNPVVSLRQFSPGLVRSQFLTWTRNLCHLFASKTLIQFNFTSAQIGRHKSVYSALRNFDHQFLFCSLVLYLSHVWMFRELQGFMWIF